MKVHTLDIDSGERDPVLYPNPTDYVVSLKNPIYDVTKISLISARIHASQMLINERNNTFSVNGITTSLPNDNYSGATLASAMTSACSNIATASYDSGTNDITFTNSSTPFTLEFYGGVRGYNTNVLVDGYTTPHDILGFSASNVSSTSVGGTQTLKTGSINIQGPDAIIVKLSSGSEEFNKTIFSKTPFYTGRILMCGDVINFSGVDDIVEHNFDSGPRNITSLRVQFFYSSNNQLIPYDFRSANHILKLAVTCSTNKLESVPKVMRDMSLPPPMKIPELEDPHRWDAFVSIFVIVLTGLILLIFMRKPKSIE